MLPHLPAFAARPTATGYLLAPLAATRSGVIRYIERVCPLQRVSDLVRARLLSGFIETARSPIEPLVTVEAEHAARITITGHHGERWVQRDFGFVFGDDFAVLLDGTCLDRAASELFTAATTELVRGVRLGMPFRRRRFRYAAPPDRVAFVRGLETDWLSAANVLTVFPAERGNLDQLSSIACRNGFMAEQTSTTAVTTIIATAPSRWRAVAGVEEAGWLYFMELTATSPRSLDPLLACMLSRSPLPAPPTTPATPLYEVD